VAVSLRKEAENGEELDSFNIEYLGPDWCEGCDFDRSQLVDFFDLGTLVDEWLWQASWYSQ